MFFWVLDFHLFLRPDLGSARLLRITPAAAMDICRACNKVILEDYVTFADGKYHEECFNCASCEKSLAGTRFLIHGSEHYCAECHEAKFAERCDVCGVTFKSGERQTTFAGKTMHPTCFSCAGGCGQSLSGKKFFIEGGQTYCAACFKGTIADKCSGCGEPLEDAFITLDGGKKKLHHACYCCSECKQSLSELGGHFEHSGGNLYCRAHYLVLVADKCSACAEPLTGQYVILDGGQKKLHQKCYCCRQCQKPLRGGHFERDGQLYCAQHQKGAGAPAGTLGASTAASLGGVDIEKKRRGIKNAFNVWESMGSDPTVMCVEVLRQKLRCDEAAAREVLAQFDTNHDGVLQVDEFVDAVLGLGLDLSKANVAEAAPVSSKAPEGVESTFQRQPTFKHDKEGNRVRAEDEDGSVSLA